MSNKFPVQLNAIVDIPTFGLGFSGSTFIVGTLHGAFLTSSILIENYKKALASHYSPRIAYYHLLVLNQSPCSKAIVSESLQYSFLRLVSHAIVLLKVSKSND